MKVSYFVPPVLIHLLNRIFRKRVRIFRTYKEAMSFCSDMAYENKTLCEIIAVKTVNYRSTIESTPINIKPSNSYLLFTVNNYIAEEKSKTVNILDFGGACGAHYFECRPFIPTGVSVKWFVLETESMVKSAREHRLGNEELVFISSFDQLNDKIDIIHSSSTIQYVPEPYKALELLMDLDAPFLVFNRMMFVDDDHDMITVQKTRLMNNGPGPLPYGYNDKELSYPHTTISYRKFLECLGKNYTEAYNFEESSGCFQIDDCSIIGKGICLRRKE